MIRRAIWLGVLSIGLALMAGCETAPMMAGPAPAAPWGEEGVNMPFEEVMVAAPVEGAHQVYQNVHVGIVATVNPRAGGTSNASQVAWFLRKLEPRAAAATLQVVTDSGTISPRKVGALRDVVAAKLEEVLAQTLRTWAHAPDYDVELTVVSLYFTDSTVGRSERGRPGL